MKKLISLCLALALVLAMAAPAMALSSTMTYKTGSGTVNQWTYTTSTGASKTRATASLTYEKAAALYACIEATAYKASDDSYVTIYKDEDASTATAVSASVSCSSTYYFDKAVGKYIVAGTSVPQVTVS